MSNDNTIFDLQQSKEDSEFIVNNIDYDFDAGTEIIEKVLSIPYIGSIIKIARSLLNYLDYRFIKKLGIFLRQSNSIPDDRKQRFINGLSAKDKSRISNYLTHLLYSANEDRKAEIMGKIYVRRLYEEIDNEMMLRLCSIIDYAFLPDLDYLSEYLEVSENNDFITDNLVSLGVLSDAGNVYEEQGEGWTGTGFGSTKHVLNSVGYILYCIMNDQSFSQGEASQTTDCRTSFEPITKKEIDGLF